MSRTGKSMEIESRLVAAEGRGTGVGEGRWGVTDSGYSSVVENESSGEWGSCPCGDSQAGLHFSFQLSSPFIKSLNCSHHPPSSNHGGTEKSRGGKKGGFWCHLLGACAVLCSFSKTRGRFPSPDLCAETAPPLSTRGFHFLVSNTAKLPEPPSKPITSPWDERARGERRIYIPVQGDFPNPWGHFFWRGHSSAAPHKSPHPTPGLRATPQSPHPEIPYYLQPAPSCNAQIRKYLLWAELCPTKIRMLKP